MLLQKTINNEDLNIRKIMEQSIRFVEDYKVKRCCEGSLKIIMS